MLKRLSVRRPFSATLLLALLVLFFTAPAAQGQELPEFNLYGGLSAPVGDFADESGSGAGAATIGFGVMGEYVQPIGDVEGLGLAGSASLLVNGADEDAFGTEDAGRYFIVPLLGGLRYRTEFSPSLDGYAIGQVGLGVTRGPTLESGDEEATSGLGTSFGFGIGAGLVLNDNINITVRYLGLGEPELEYEDDDGGEFEIEPAVNAVQVMIGFTL